MEKINLSPFMELFAVRVRLRPQTRSAARPPRAWRGIPPPAPNQLICMACFLQQAHPAHHHGEIACGEQRQAARTAISRHLGTHRPAERPAGALQQCPRQAEAVEAHVTGIMHGPAKSRETQPPQKPAPYLANTSRAKRPICGTKQSLILSTTAFGSRSGLMEIGTSRFIAPISHPSVIHQPSPSCSASRRVSSCPPLVRIHEYALRTDTSPDFSIVGKKPIDL